MTLEQIIIEIRKFVSAHRQLKSFFEGDIFDFDLTKSQLYPVFTTTLLPSSIGEGVESFTFQFGVFDKLDNDLANRINVLSDARQICTDFIAYMRNNPAMDTIDIGLPITLEDFSTKFTDFTAGYFFTASLSQHQGLNFCQLPINSEETFQVLGTDDNKAIITNDGKLILI